MHNARFWAQYIREAFIPQIALLREGTVSRVFPGFEHIDKGCIFWGHHTYFGRADSPRRTVTVRTPPRRSPVDGGMVSPTAGGGQRGAADWRFSRRRTVPEGFFGLPKELRI